MNPLARFGEYAAAFEVFYETNDTGVLEPFFSEEAVYALSGGPPFAGRHEGRAAIFDYFKLSLDGFDRRFETRELSLLAGPELRGGAVWLRWRASYRSPGVPELVVDGEETVHFDGDRISLLEDDFELQASSLVEHWFKQYGARLDG